MNEKDLKISPYWLRHRNKKTAGGKKIKLEDLQTTEHLSKNENRLEVYSFIKKCILKAQQKHTIKNALNNSTASKKYSFPSMFSKFKIVIFSKIL